MMGWLTGFAPFSVMELLITLVILATLFFLIWGVVRTIRLSGKRMRLYKGITGFLAAGLLILDGYC